MSNLVTEEMMGAALQFLSENTMATAKAKADRVMAEYARKRCRARLIVESNQTSFAMKEASAEASEAYLQACQFEADAVERDEYFRAARAKAEAIIEAWRTENANIRAAERVR